MEVDHFRPHVHTAVVGLYLVLYREEDRLIVGGRGSRDGSGAILFDVDNYNYL